MNLAEIGVSSVAVGLLVPALVQGYKALSSRVAWLPRTTGGATSTLAYGVALVLMWGLSLVGYGPEAQEGIVEAATLLLLSVAPWLVSQGLYNGVKAVSHAGTT